MPVFIADRMEYGLAQQFGAEKSCYVLKVGPPRPRYVRDGETNPEQPMPVKDSSRFRTSVIAHFYPGYDQTLISEPIARAFCRKKPSGEEVPLKRGDWILLSLRDFDQNTGILHEHGCYVRVDEIIERGDPRFREKLFRVSSGDLKHQFDFNENVRRDGPLTIPLSLKRITLPCYDPSSATKDDFAR